jgi:hypothetical protein
MFPLRTLLERLGFSRQLGLIVAFFALTIVCLLGLVGAALHVTSGVRAYVGGEGLWSKSQKAAVARARARDRRRRPGARLLRCDHRGAARRPARAARARATASRSRGRDRRIRRRPQPSRPTSRP